jgi:glutamate 5-kinase
MPDARLLGGLVAEIAALKKDGHQVILVSSGAVGTGRAMMKQAQSRLRPSSAERVSGAQSSRAFLQNCDTVAERQILASLGQARLVALYQELLTPHDILASQILLTKQDFRSQDHHRHMSHLFAALRQQSRLLPIVNENDCVTVDELMFTDNDELAGLLAAMMNADRLIILSHIAGVYDRPPDEEGAAIIPLINFATKTGLPSATRGKSATGRGGMVSKLGMARKLATLGIRVHVAAAREPNILVRLLRDESIGTTVAPMKVKRNAVKRWLASEVSNARASVTANECLVEMMRKPGAALSLLPVGLTKISGDFDKGDLVRIIDETGRDIAIGVARYGASDLRPTLGKKNKPVFIHYDQLHAMSHDEPA